MTLHFDRLELAEGDHLLLSTPDGRRSKTYDHRAKDRGAFYSIPFYDDTIVVKLFSTGAESAYGVKIDQLTFGIRKPGYSTKELSICGVDENENIKCVENTYPARYNNRTPVARIIVNGVPDATGFLFGSDGYFLTAYHFLETSQPPQLDFEWLYESDFCPGFCDEGVIEDVDYTMIKYVDNSTLDYALLRLHDSNGSSSSLDKYGYLQTRNYDILEKEPIYIIHHPLGHCKQIAYTSDQAADEDGIPVAHPHTLPYRIEHYLDTQGGSSGAPIFSMYDNLVVALHKGGGCPNEAIRMTDIVASLQEDGLLPPGAIKATCGDGADFVVAAGSTQTFAKDQVFTGNLFIEEGATATVNPGKVLSFGANNGIYIKPGGRLIMEAGSVLKNCIYSDHWRGVQVWGNIVASQYPQNGQYEQGYLEMKTGATIENAETAVMLYNNVSPGLTGGILVANGAIFRNNITSIDTRYYQNFYPYSIPTGWQGQPRDYFSTIKLCQFIVDDDFPHEDKFHAFINLMDVNGVTITGCSFTNAMTDAGNSIADWGYGIFATDAGFRVQGLCNGSTYPCEDYTRSEFRGLGYGIFTGVVIGSIDAPYTVRQADFHDCFVGIHNRGVMGGIMLHNDFYLGNLPSLDLTLDQIGIALNNSINIMTLEENNFIEVAGDESIRTFGISSFNIGATNKTIRRNTFTGVNVGNEAGGICGDNDSGLLYECNFNTGNTEFDFLICDNDFFGTNRIKKDQVSMEQDGDIATGNRFSNTGSPTDRDFSNQGGFPIDYYHKINGGALEIPDEYSGIDNLIEITENECPVTYCEPPCKTPSEVALLKQAFYTEKGNYQIAYGEYENALNNGNDALAAQKLSEASRHRQLMDENGWLVLVHAMYDTLTWNRDTIRKWLSNMDYFGTEMTLAFDYLNTGEGAVGQAVLNIVPVKFDLTPEQSADLSNAQILFDMLTQQSVYDLDEEALEQLDTIAQTNGEFTPGIAKNILTRYDRYFGTENCEHETEMRSAKTESNPNTSITKSPFQVYPNPARNQVTFERLGDTSSTTAILLLTDITGKVVWRQQFKEGVVKIIWHTSGIPDGIYFYRLVELDGTAWSGRVVLQK